MERPRRMLFGAQTGSVPRIRRRPTDDLAHAVTYCVPSTERLLNAKRFLATATEECCPARGTLAGHFTRRLSPSPMPGKRIQPQRAYLPLKRSSPRPQFYRLQPRDPWARLAQPMPVRWTGCHSRVRGIASKDRLLDEYQALLLSDQLVRQSVIPASASDCDPAYSLRRVPT